MALKEGLSDMDYLRSKVVKKPDNVDDKAEEEGEEDNAEEEEEEGGPVQQLDSAYESGDKDSLKATTPLSLSQNKVCSSFCEAFLNIILCKMFDFHFLMLSFFHSLNLLQNSQSNYEEYHSPLKR